MAFMQPQYTREAFHVADNRSREREACPANVYGTLDRFMDEIGTHDEDREDGCTIEGKWWCRLSAPGYMDCTDWDGPFDTEQAARNAIVEAFDVDPDTGADEFEEGPWSGYHDCPCRDCFEIAIGGSYGKPDLCNACEEAGCDADGKSECSCEHKEEV